MAKVILGNHTAVVAARSEQDRIRKFYCDVLGCKVRVKTDEVDRFQLHLYSEQKRVIPIIKYSLEKPEQGIPLATAGTGYRVGETR